jgi:hypothetical protein
MPQQLDAEWPWVVRDIDKSAVRRIVDELMKAGTRNPTTVGGTE